MRIFYVIRIWFKKSKPYLQLIFIKIQSFIKKYQTAFSAVRGLPSEQSLIDSSVSH